MTLKTLLKYEAIDIQCHNNPDADAIASGYGLYRYFQDQGKEVRLIYSGWLPITKPNLLLMVDILQIPLTYVKEFEAKELLITVDCQYGAGNVVAFKAPTVAVIDHHQKEIEQVELTEIQSRLGSSSTLVWSMLKEAGYDINQEKDLATALYYGLLTDTNMFAEIAHPLDKDMRDSLEVDQRLIRRLMNSNLTLKDIETAGVALLRCSHNEADNFAVMKANPCDPNILGVISDMALQVDSIDTCIVYSHTEGGIKYSVRSCVGEVMANEMAAFISENIGSGGGHREKAGGFIQSNKYNHYFSDLNMDAYFLGRIRAYYDSFDIVYGANHQLKIDEMSLYSKKPMAYGYVATTDLAAEGLTIMVRTLKGDLNIMAAKERIILIGLLGDVTTINRETFIKGYQLEHGNFMPEADYIPHIVDGASGNSVNLVQYARLCVSLGNQKVYAKSLTKYTKVFTSDHQEGYMSGKPGDFIALNVDAPLEAFIIEKAAFEESYEA